jgi:hypothetical protein
MRRSRAARIPGVDNRRYRMVIRFATRVATCNGITIPTGIAR